jgi:predicted transcriptional regulator of viral defense system
MTVIRAAERSRSLEAYADALQASGRYTFVADEARCALDVSDVALRNAARRLIQKGRLVAPRRGFYVVVPVEYRSAGAPPPSWFVDDLMRFQGQPYYVGLLSAAALHGAAHQQPQEFQVVTDVPLRPAAAGRARIRFIFKRRIADVPLALVKTETGTLRVSTPEATALDLVRYVEVSGHLGNVATVLAELADLLDPQRLATVAVADVEIACVQRLGHLLEKVGAGDKLEPLAALIADRSPRFVRLRPDRPRGDAARDKRWRVLINEDVEVEA